MLFLKIFILKNKQSDLLNFNSSIVFSSPGTNNLSIRNTPEDIAHAVRVILSTLEAKVPNAKVILLGVLPRGDSAINAKVKELNGLLEKLVDNNRVHWLNMWNQFADSNGQIKTDLFHADGVHLVEKGYQVWQQTMELLLNKLNPNSINKLSILSSSKLFTCLIILLKIKLF